MARCYDVIVVGGGVVGLAAARRAASEGASVLLIEREKALGGLLRSTRSPQGAWFDCGTHIPALTGRPRLDEILFHDLASIQWHSFSRLRKGNYFCSQLDTRTQFIDVTKLPKEDYVRGFLETISSVTEAPQGESLSHALRSRYGNHLVDTVFAPLIERIYRQPLDFLSDRAHLFLALNRIVLANSEVSRELKRSSVYDAKLAYAGADEGAVIATYMYPQEGGCGAWMDALRKAAEQNGVEVRTGVSIEALDAVRRCAIVSGESLEYGQLVWTAQIELLARMLEPEFRGNKPVFVPVRLYHFQMPLCPDLDSHYICVNAPEMISFRITLYGNVLNDKSDGRITVEAVDYDGSEDIQRVIAELRQIGLLSASGAINCVMTERLNNGFPLLSVNASEGVERAHEIVRSHASILTAGRGRGDSFFMNDVLCDLDTSMNAVFSN